MKNRKMRRSLALALLLAMAFTAVTGGAVLAYVQSSNPYYYNYYNSNYDYYDYYRYNYYNYNYDYYDYYRYLSDSDGFISVYPVDNYYCGYQYYSNPYYYGGYTYPGYYYYGGGNDRQYLGGANVPTGMRSNIVVNNRDMNWTVLGRSLASEGSTGSISPISSNNLYFVESLGRAEDESLCLIISVSSSVAADNQEVLGLYGRIEGLEKMKAEGIESIAIINASGSLRVTYNISEVIKYAKSGFNKNDASISRDGLLLSTMPADNKIIGELGELRGAQYSSEVFCITASGTKAIEISSSMSESNAHIILRSDGKGADLLGVSGEDAYKAGAVKTIQKNGAYYVTGYLPIGSAFAPVAGQ